MSAAKRVLLVEDEWIIAADTQDMLESAGCKVIGPAATVAAALKLLDEEAVDTAILDVHLTREMSLPVAEVLIERNVPFVFVTGFAPSDLPPRFRGCPILTKPWREDTLLRALGVLDP